MTIFLLIRHATTEMVGRAIAGWMPGEHLSAEGRRQAERFAERLGGARIAAIYSSPLERALETAAPLAERLGLTVQVREGAGEIHFGDWTGRELEELAPVPEWHRFNVYRSGTRIPGGETMLEVQARIAAELERLRHSHPHAAVAVVSHGDVIRAAVVHFAGMSLDLFDRIEIEPASVSVIAVGDYRPRILRLNETGELPQL